MRCCRRPLRLPRTRRTTMRTCNSLQRWNRGAALCLAACVASAIPQVAFPEVKDLDVENSKRQAVIDAGYPEINHDIEVAGNATLPPGWALLSGWSFESAGVCIPAGWTTSASPPFAPILGHLYPHATDNDKCTENTTCAWLFTDTVTPTVACDASLGWSPGGLVLPAGVDQYLTSPVVSLAGFGALDRTLLSTRNFPGNSFPGSRIAINWSVRSQVAGVFGAWQRVNQFNSLSLWSWINTTLDLTPYIDPAATDIQIRYRVVDWGPGGIPCATTPGADCGPGPGPYLDSVVLARLPMTGPSISEGIDSRSQGQDCFPALLNGIPVEHYSPTTSRFETCPFSAGADETTCGVAPLLTTDAIHVRVVDAGATGGIAKVAFYGAIVAGPHTGKAPAPYV